MSAPVKERRTLRLGKATRASVPARSVELGATIIVGPETAARLGLPVGSKVDLGTIAYWNKNPILRFWGRITRRRH
jgi:hypothetical protein